MSLFVEESDYDKLKQQIVKLNKLGFAQSELNKLVAGNIYLTPEIIKLYKIEIMKRILETEI